MKRYNPFYIIAVVMAILVISTPSISNAQKLKNQLSKSDRSTNSTARSTVKNGAYKNFTVRGIIFTMIQVNGGTFTMGARNSDNTVSESAKPAHSVTVSTFAIGQTEVTQELWEAVMGSNPSKHVGGQFPVENVNYNDCKRFITKLNQLTGKNFRLPYEAEWEYAALGGSIISNYEYIGNNDADVVAWSSSNSDRTTHPVATKRANALGIYDMAGNVAEWCEDWDYDYTSRSQTNPHGASSGSSKILRGGSIELDFNNRAYRPKSRDALTATANRSDVGLRLVLEGGF